MSEPFVKISGIEECCADLRRVSSTARTVGLVRGLHAAAAVIEREIDIWTPVRTNRVGGDQDYQSLITDLQVRVGIDTRFRGGSAQIGFFRQAYLANWVEFGHRMVGHKPLKKNLGAAVPAHPFMRPAADVAAEPAVEAFVDAVNEALAGFSEEAA
jgi:hypothetical protein